LRLGGARSEAKGEKQERGAQHHLAMMPLAAPSCQSAYFTSR
jgi:hypothetical protein